MLRATRPQLAFAMDMLERVPPAQVREREARPGLTTSRVHGRGPLNPTAWKLSAFGALPRSSHRSPVHPPNPPQNMASLLINSVTRLPRYMLLCREILKNLEKVCRHHHARQLKSTG